MSVNPFTGDIYLGIMSISYLSTQCPSPSTPCPVLLLAPLSLSLVSDTRPLLFFVTKPMAHVIVAAILPSFAPTLSDDFPLLAAVVATPLVPLLPPRSRCHCHPAHCHSARAVTATPLAPPLPPRSRRHCHPVPRHHCHPTRAVAGSASSLFALCGNLPCRHNRARLPGMWELWEQCGR